MKVPSLIFLTSLSALLLIFLPKPTSARCCSNYGFEPCGDNSMGTPCCGYHQCNAFCCACKGVNVARQPVSSPTVVAGRPLISYWITAITADCGVTWTCRADHITSYPPETPCPTYFDHQKRAADPTAPAISGPATITSAPRGLRAIYDLESVEARDTAVVDIAETYSLFAEVSEGADTITLDQYLGLFGYNTSSPNNRHKDSVIAKFYLHDKDGDGMLTIEEVGRRCGPDHGCDDE